MKNRDEMPDLIVRNIIKLEENKFKKLKKYFKKQFLLFLFYNKG